jgi:hypothetical protein
MTLVTQFFFQWVAQGLKKISTSKNFPGQQDSTHFVAQE